MFINRMRERARFMAVQLAALHQLMFNESRNVIIMYVYNEFSSCLNYTDIARLL